jgi:hypothetical protein
MVLLKLQPYTQSSVANKPFSKLSYKYFGPYKVIERVGPVAYRLELPQYNKIHDAFHVSQLKPFLADYSLVYSNLPMTTDLQAAAATPEKMLECHLVKKGSAVIPQVLIKWTDIPQAFATWEDYNMVHKCFPEAADWGQAGPSAGGDVRHTPTSVE